MSPPRAFTLVAFHAHPDDEALLTAGTMARAAAEGHRVVLVVATAGGAGETSAAFVDRGRADLAARRLRELHRSAAALDCARVESLGYADSGLLTGRTPGGEAMRAPDAFSVADVEDAALRLAAILTEEQADVLLSYDPAGGYGHPDHRQVHRVGARAAELAGTPVLLEATVDRDLLLRGARALGVLLRALPRLAPNFDAAAFEGAYTARSDLTHRVSVGRYTKQKRAALAAHASQAAGDAGVRTVGALLRLPQPAFRLLLGTEWFVERARPAGGPLLDDVLATLR